VLLLKKDAERIAAHTKKPLNSFAAETFENAHYVYEMQKDPQTGQCIFLQNNQCIIYSVRPLICRFYPFELSTDSNGVYVFKATEECPAIMSGPIGSGEKLDAAFFKALLELAHAEIEGDSPES
jgi:Fe-S-cluster containining protein